MGSVSKCINIHKSTVINGEKVQMLDIKRLNEIAKDYSDEASGDLSDNWKSRDNYPESMIKAAQYMQNEWEQHRDAVDNYVKAEYKKTQPKKEIKEKPVEVKAEDKPSTPTGKAFDYSDTSRENIAKIISDIYSDSPVQTLKQLKLSNPNIYGKISKAQSFYDNVTSDLSLSQHYDKDATQASIDEIINSGKVAYTC